ncbi:MAG: PepSY-like domain-containing protein [Ferruginibacter sp.]
MKQFIFLFATGLCAMGAQAQKLSPSKVPAPVKATMQQQYPAVQKINWEKENGHYEAGFVAQAKHCSVLLDATGAVLETEVEITKEALPATAKAYLLKYYPGIPVKEAATITDAKGIVTYEAEVKGADLIFDNKGQFIKKITNQ